MWGCYSRVEEGVAGIESTKKEALVPVLSRRCCRWCDRKGASEEIRWA